MISRPDQSPLYRIVLSEPIDHASYDRFSWRSKVHSQRGARHAFGSKSWILLTGCFDGERLHRGHRSLIQALSAIAPVVVGVESDETLWWNKGMFRPRMHLDVRVERLAKLPEVAMVVPFSEVALYNFAYGSRKSSDVFLSRMMRMRPPMVPVYCNDPHSPYPMSVNADAKRIGATRLVYDYYSTESTSRLLGY